VYGNIYIDECKVLGASYLRETSSVLFGMLFKKKSQKKIVQMFSFQW